VVPTNLKAFLASRPKIVARTRHGERFKGCLMDGRAIVRGVLRMKNLEGRDLPLDLEQLKGIFFVRDYEGDKEYLESKTLTSDPERKGLRVRIRFEDNESMEGVVENSVELLQAAGFFFWPADPKANNELIFVVKSALLGFSVLGVK
jgi:hypothetical protein